MGAWGHGPFDNDDALDWLSMLEDEGAAAISAALATATDTDYLEAPDASMIIAAAEVIAAASGHGAAAEPPDELAAFVATRPDLLSLRSTATAALDRVLAVDSELDELWRDSDDYAAWRATVADLQSRLAR